MKQGIDYLDMMNKKHQVLFLKNLSERGDCTISDYLNREFATFRTFVGGAFTWNTSPEGEKYWGGYTDRMEAKLGKA